MSENHRVLAADVGGTHTRVLLAESNGTQCTALREQRYASTDWPDLAPILCDFLADETAMPQRACLAVAGPVTGNVNTQHARVTNLPWAFDSDSLSATLNIARITLINDFAAVGHGIAALGDSDLVTLQAGEPQRQAPRAVLGAGTGLGQALLVRCGEYYDVLPTEGGHTDFAPQNELQIELLRALQREHGHVSYERLLSGAGLAYIYRFLQRDDTAPAIEPAAVSAAALAGTDPIAVQALDAFVALYGAQAGNLALACLPFGGLYVAGGIAPKILERLRDGRFIAAFNAKGRMAPVTRRVPVQVVVHPNPGLLGAALVAGRSE